MPHEVELINAIVKGTVEDIETLIAQGVDLRALPGHGLLGAITRSPIGPYEVSPGRSVMAPNKQYRLEILQCLLAHAADPNAIPLAEVCLRGDADVVKLLLDHCANANDRVAMDHILERLPFSTGRHHIDWLKKLQHLLHAGAPTDVAGLSAITKEYPWLLE